MKQNIKILITLLILPPVIAELLSGSSPPLEFFKPSAFIFAVMLYGCGALLIREARVRWNMQWSVVLLAIGYGIVEEALTTKAFFNINWADVGVYAKYGTVFGVLVPWSIVLLTFHATLSTLIPILIIDLTWPEYKKTSVLGKRGLIFTFTSFILSALLGFIFMGTLVNGKMIPFYPHPLLIIGSIVLIIILIFLGYRLRNRRIITKNRIFTPRFFSFFAFLFMIAFAIVPYQLAKVDFSQIGIFAYQMSVILVAFVFVCIQILNIHFTSIHSVSLVFGSLAFWSLHGVFLEFQGITGMGLVGAATVVLMLIWKKKIIRKSLI